MSDLVNIRDSRNGNWYWINRRIYTEYSRKIGVIGLAIYNAYASYANRYGESYPSQKLLSETLGISIPCIIKYNKILEKNGLVRIERRKEEGKANTVYLLELGRELKRPKEPNKSARTRLKKNLTITNIRNLKGAIFDDNDIKIIEIFYKLGFKCEQGKEKELSKWLDEINEEYDDRDIVKESKKFYDWWEAQSRKVKSHKLAFRNWLNNSRKFEKYDK